MNSDRNFKVLVVDDSKLFANTIKNIVSAKYEVVGVALSGQEALDKFVSLEPDIVLLDVTMPNMDGRECLERLVAINPKVIVIMISGIQKTDLQQECLRIGAAMFISKDQIKIDQNPEENFLLRSIQEILSNNLFSRAS